MRWQRSVDAALRPLGLTHSRYLVLSATAELQRETKDAVSQREIAARCPRQKYLQCRNAK